MSLIELITRLVMNEGRISEPTDMSMETPQTEIKRKKNKKRKKNCQELWDNKKNTCNENTRKKKEKRKRGNV